MIAFTCFNKPFYTASGHHIELAHALEKWWRGEEGWQNLIVNMPPQRGKTELASICGVAFGFANYPDTRVALVSYAAETAERMSRDVQDIIRSDRFGVLFPNLQIAQGRANVALWKWQNHRGYIRATGVDGPLTSFGAERAIIDDPHKDRATAESEIERQRVKDWYRSVLLTRLSPDAGQLIIQTRWHEDDLTGFVLEQNPGKWRVIHFPAVKDAIYQQDEHGKMRLVGGEPLWPEKWSLQSYAEQYEDVGPREWEALFQGNPVPREGALFKRKYFWLSPRAPEGLKWIRSWDLATSEKTSADFTVGVLMAMDVTRTLWIKDVVRGQWEWPEARKRIMQCARMDGEEVDVYVEKGAFQFSSLARDLVDNWEEEKVALRTVSPTKDKYTRASPWAARAENGRVALVRDHWNEEFLKEVLAFPFGKNDDQVDAVSQGYDVLAGTKGEKSAKRPPPQRSYAWFDKLASNQGATKHVEV